MTTVFKYWTIALFATIAMASGLCAEVICQTDLSVPEAAHEASAMFRFQGQLNLLTAPTGLRASDGTYSSKIVISWDAVQDADLYMVLRASTEDGPKEAMSQWQSETTYEDTDTTLFKTYYYWVIAKNATGTSPLSDSETGFTFLIIAPPNPPANVAASDGTFHNKIRISWDASAQAQSYQVYLLDIGSIQMVLPVSEALEETWFDYTNAILGKTYRFAVRANNTMGASDLSDSDTGSIGEGSIKNDYCGNGKADMACYSAASGNWYISNDAEENELVNWGWEDAVSVPADYDNDGQTDVAVYWPDTGNWYINGTDADFETINWGWEASIPVPGDYDGDGVTDLAVYWPQEGNWYINQSQDGYAVIDWGWNASIPVPADYDGDGTTDIAVFYPTDGNWYIRGSTESFPTINWGWQHAIPVPGDYDGDTRADLVVYSTEHGQWFMKLSANGFFTITFGDVSSWPVGGDYDGDGKTDLSTYSPVTRQWQIKYAAGGDDFEYVWAASAGFPADLMTSVYVLYIRQQY